VYSVHADRSKTHQSDTTLLQKEYHFIHNYGRSKLDLLYRVTFYLELSYVRLIHFTLNLQGNIAFYNPLLVVIVGLYISRSFIKFNVKI